MYLLFSNGILGVGVVQEEEVVVMVSFILKSSSLFSFVLHFVAFSSSSCGGSGADVVQHL
jgi:hypothetical protein